MTYYSNDWKPTPYGQQWREGEPVPDSYGVDSHPERFGGLHSVALAFVEHLATVYDVEVQDNSTHATDLLIEAVKCCRCEGDTTASLGCAADVC